MPVRDCDGDLEAGLEGRLVEAGEDAARVGRLALGEGVAAPAGLGGVEAAEVLIEGTGEAQPDDRLTGRERAGEAEGDGLVRALETRPRRDLPAADLGRRTLDLQTRGVERDRGARAVEAHRDPDLAREPAGIEVGLEMQIVFRRPDVAGQTEAGWAAAGGGHRVSRSGHLAAAQSFAITCSPNRSIVARSPNRQKK